MKQQQQQQKKMATKTNNLSDDGQQRLHRRVQHKIAKHYLDQVDPDGELTGERKDRLQQFKEIDPKTKRLFDEQHKQFKKSESAYSIQNVCWLIAAMGVFYYSDFYRIALYHPRINRLWFNLGGILIALNVTIAAFLIVWLSFIKKLHSDEWEKRYPAAIPVATGSFVLGSIFLTAGLWPIYGLLTPILLFVMFMGVVVTIAMIPSL